MLLGLSEFSSGTVSVTGSHSRTELLRNRQKIGFFVG